MKAVFLDRDGVICQNRKDYVKSWSEFQFLHRSREAIARLTEAGLQVVIVTNQSAINRGIVSVGVVEDIHRRMVEQIEIASGRIARVYYCPHRPDEDCHCRKPEPGMLLQAAQELGIDLTHSYLVGDALTDILAAQAVGVEAFMVLTGRGKRQYLDALLQKRDGFQLAPNLWQAVNTILWLESTSEGPSRSALSQQGLSAP